MQPAIGIPKAYKIFVNYLYKIRNHTKVINYADDKFMGQVKSNMQRDMKIKLGRRQMNQDRINAIVVNNPYIWAIMGGLSQRNIYRIFRCICFNAKIIRKQISWFNVMQLLAQFQLKLYAKMQQTSFIILTILNTIHNADYNCWQGSETMREEKRNSSLNITKSPIGTRYSTDKNNSSKNRDKMKSILNLHQKSEENFHDILKKIPKYVQFEKNQLVGVCLSYIDEGLEKWKIGHVIGKGNSYVREAMNIKTGMRAAVKQVFFDAKEENEKLKEIKILQSLSHSNIVQYLEHYKVQSQTWIFMEYVSMNLRRFYRDYGPPPFPIFMTFAKQLVQALAYLEQEKVVHKDIKCENVLFDDGVIKLCDFGCSKQFQSTLSLQKYQQNPHIKSTKASYLWTAPEFYLTDKFSFASDIWSLGCTLVELASGNLPWAQQQFDNQFMAIKYIVYNDVIPLIDQKWNERAKQLISCCLKRDPKERLTAAKLLEKVELWQ